NGFQYVAATLYAAGLSRLRTEPLFAGAERLRSPLHLIVFFAVLGGLVVYILIAVWLGFIPTAFLLMSGWLMLFRGGKPVSSAVIALLSTLVVNYAFTQLLLVPLPLGLLRYVLY